MTKLSQFELTAPSERAGRQLLIDGQVIEGVARVQLDVPAIGPTKLIIHLVNLPGVVKGEAEVEYRQAQPEKESEPK